MPKAGGPDPKDGAARTHLAVLLQPFLILFIQVVLHSGLLIIWCGNNIPDVCRLVTHSVFCTTRKEKSILPLRRHGGRLYIQEQLEFA